MLKPFAPRCNPNGAETGIEPAPSAWKAGVSTIELLPQRGKLLLPGRWMTAGVTRPSGGPRRFASRVPGLPAIGQPVRFRWFEPTSDGRLAHSSWWRVDDCGRPCLRPSGAAPLRVAFRITPAIRSNRSLSVVEPTSGARHVGWWRWMTAGVLPSAPGAPPPSRSGSLLRSGRHFLSVVRTQVRRTPWVQAGRGTSRAQSCF